jgi:hypothetical protein
MLRGLPTGLLHRLDGGQHQDHRQDLVLLRRPELPTGLLAGLPARLPDCQGHQGGGDGVVLP